MELAEIKLFADRILDQHLQGRRETAQTIENLLALLARESPQNGALLDYLWEQLVSSLSTPSSELASGRELKPSIIRVVMGVFLKAGDAQRRFLQLFTHLNYDHPVIRKNWIRHVLPTITAGILEHRDRLSAEFLEALKGYCEQYLDKRNRQFIGIDTPDETFLFALKQVTDAIEEVEFSNFETKLRTSPKTLSSLQIGSTISAFSEVPNEIAKALSKADEYLHSKGEFDAKIAGDLLRTSMDEAHRAIVLELSTARLPYSGGEKDGARRKYMCELGFISVAEEQFFSAVYTLISNEGTHRLVAPRETILLMHDTVVGYVQLLFRRLATWKAVRNLERVTPSALSGAITIY